MKKILYLLLITAFLSCNNERVLQLPEIENAEVTEVLDVSPAYIFYDETQPDSTLFNRKNLIGTTNWLVNVDKRLTLRQAIPHIQYLQNKRKKASMHKNEAAKNYFTCNDTSIKNLGFLEFTDVEYVIDIESYEPKNETSIGNNNKFVLIHFFDNGYLNITEFFDGKQTMDKTLEIDRYFNSDLFKEYQENKNLINISFDIRMNFQLYIALKYQLINYLSDMSEISNVEFIY